MISNCPCLDRQAVQGHRPEDDPGDREQAKCRAVQRGARQKGRGIPYTVPDTTMTVASPRRPDFQAASRNTPRETSMTAIGNAATSADAPKLPATGI